MAMRGVTIELPAAARAKLAELELQRDGALDSMRGAAGRLMSLPRDAHELRARLEIERDRHAERHRVLAMLCSRLNQFCVELRLPRDDVLQLSPPVEIKLKASETAVAALAMTRAQIAGVQADMATVRKAPLRRSSQQEAIRAYLARLEQQVRPQVSFDARGAARVLWTEDMIAGKDDLLGLLSFVLGPDALLAAFTRELEQEAERSDAVTPLEREKRLGELSAQLFGLEQLEEGLVLRAQADGSDVLRRADADPRVVLGLTITQAQAQVA
jgi:hypothetical protein